MLKTAFFYFTFWAILLVSIIFLIPYYVLKLTAGKRVLKRFVYFITTAWARFILGVNGVSYTAHGQENIPAPGSALIVVSNHQGSFDIPIYISCLPFSVGFIAKHELKKMPLINVWMKALDCVFINRKRYRESAEKINERIQQKDKNPIFIFPEGTRSKGPHMGAFKPGSLKLLFNAGTEVLPVTISGSYKYFELYKNVKSGNVDLFFHPVVRSSDYKPDDFDQFLNDLHQIIASPLITNEQK